MKSFLVFCLVSVPLVLGASFQPGAPQYRIPSQILDANTLRREDRQPVLDSRNQLRIFTLNSMAEVYADFIRGCQGNISQAYELMMNDERFNRRFPELDFVKPTMQQLLWPGVFPKQAAEDLNIDFPRIFGVRLSMSILFSEYVVNFNGDYHQAYDFIQRDNYFWKRHPHLYTEEKFPSLDDLLDKDYFPALVAEEYDIYALRLQDKEMKDLTKRPSPQISPSKKRSPSKSPNSFLEKLRQQVEARDNNRDTMELTSSSPTNNSTTTTVISRSSSGTPALNIKPFSLSPPSNAPSWSYGSAPSSPVSSRNSPCPSPSSFLSSSPDTGLSSPLGGSSSSSCSSMSYSLDCSQEDSMDDIGIKMNDHMDRASSQDDKHDQTKRLRGTSDDVEIDGDTNMRPKKLRRKMPDSRNIARRLDFADWGEQQRQQPIPTIITFPSFSPPVPEAEFQPLPMPQNHPASQLFGFQPQPSLLIGSAFSLHPHFNPFAQVHQDLNPGESRDRLEDAGYTPDARYADD